MTAQNSPPPHTHPHTPPKNVQNLNDYSPPSDVSFACTVLHFLTYPLQVVYCTCVLYSGLYNMPNTLCIGVCFLSPAWRNWSISPRGHPGLPRPACPSVPPEATVPGSPAPLDSGHAARGEPGGRTVVRERFLSPHGGLRRHR